MCLAIISGVITFVPAEEHCYAAPEDVEFSPLLLQQVTALFPERRPLAAGFTLSVHHVPLRILIEACSCTSSSATFAFLHRQCHIDEDLKFKGLITLTSFCCTASRFVTTSPTRSSKYIHM